MFRSRVSLRRTTRASASAVAFDISESPTQLASGSTDGTWQLWDLRVGGCTPVAEVVHAHHDAVLSLSVQGARVLTASSDGRAMFWDARRLPPRDPAEATASASERRFVSDVQLLGLRPPPALHKEPAKKAAEMCSGPCCPSLTSSPVAGPMEPFDEFVISQSVGPVY